MNDSESGETLPSCTLLWELLAGAEEIAKGELSVSDVPYYSNRWIDVSMPVPEKLPAARVDSVLRIRLMKNDQVLSANDYDVTLATRAWAEQGLTQIAGVALLDPAGEAPAGLRSLKLKQVSSAGQLHSGQHLVVAGAEKVLAEPELADGVDRFVREGGRALLLNPRTKLAERYPLLIAQYRAREGEIVGMQIPESRVFSEIEPLDLSWFERGVGNIPIACSGAYQVNRCPEITSLASTVNIHGYLRTPGDVVRVSGSPLVELRAGNGMILSSEMFLEADLTDPIAGRLLSNLIHHLRDGAAGR